MKPALRRLEGLYRALNPTFVVSMAVLSCLGFGFTSPSHASPIQFVFEGIAEIQIDAQNFSGAFRIEALADTNDIEISPSLSSHSVFVPASATILGPFGTGTFSQPVRIRSFQAGLLGGLDGIGFSAFNGDLFSAVFDPIFDGFHLDSALGPVALADPLPIASAGAQLDIGQLSLTGVRNLTFTSTPIPEPSSALLIAGGLIGLRLTRRRPA